MTSISWIQLITQLQTKKGRNSWVEKKGHGRKMQNIIVSRSLEGWTCLLPKSKRIRSCWILKILSLLHCIKREQIEYNWIFSQNFSTYNWSSKWGHNEFKWMKNSAVKNKMSFFYLIMKTCLLFFCRELFW